MKSNSRLNDHVLKKGILKTPMNNALGNKLRLNSWAKDRLPEFLWLGLIMFFYSRQEGFKKGIPMLQEVSELFEKPMSPKLSMILEMSSEKQKRVFELITKYIDARSMSPLTVIYRNSEYPVFNEFFNIPELSFEDRLNVLNETLKLLTPHQTNEATDIRYLVVTTCGIQFGGEAVAAEDLMEQYPDTEHGDEAMMSYRPLIRCLEGSQVMAEGVNHKFCEKFWKEIGMITSCKLLAIPFEKNETDYNRFIQDCRKALKYVFAINKEDSFLGHKFDVILGSVNYALKIFIELHEKGLGNSILGRHGVRTINEMLIMIKYMLENEAKKPDIWEKYKLYGMNNIKLVLLKARETDFDKSSHFVPEIADVYVNEIIWEEFMDVDFKYFDKKGIREKSCDVDEQDLYGLYYDYDSNYVHGLWGAIRESSMLTCVAPAHFRHYVPDFDSKQASPDIMYDAHKSMCKLMLVLSEVYQFPNNLKSRVIK